MEVKVKNFEGPLDLLLKLIEKQEMDITKVSLATIAEQYVEHIKISSEIKPEEIGDFLVIASKLLFLKSKILLPYFNWDEEEEEDSQELEKQLKIYKEFLEASKKIEEIGKKKQFSFVPSVGKNSKNRMGSSDAPVFSPPQSLTAPGLSQVFKRVLEDLGHSESLKERLQEEKIDRQVSLEEKIENIRSMVWKKIKFSFDKITQNTKNKTEIIVSFLAILELSKQKVIVTEQKDLFDTINIDPQSYEQE